MNMLENILKKGYICNALFKKYLHKSLIQVNINDRWVHWINGINFKDLKTFINIIELSRESIIRTGQERYYIKTNEDIECYKDYERVPMGPKIKIYHYFVHGVRFPPKGTIPALM